MSKPNDQNTKTDNPTTDDAAAANNSSGQTASGNQPAPAAQPPAKTEEPTFTKADIDKAVADALKESKKEAEKAAEREKLSKEERLQLELDEAKRETAMIKAESEVVEALENAGAKSPKLLFEAKRSSLEFKDGKLTNLAEVVADLKIRYSDQFGVEKPAQTIDAGAGQETKKERPETLGGALKNYYKK